MAFANTQEGDKDKEKEPAQCEQEKKDKPAEAAAPVVSKAVSYSDASEKSRLNEDIVPGLKNKPDSSSVLSYNFIFYLVYKFKYTAESEEEFSQESRTTD